jgi:septum formation protein
VRSAVPLVLASSSPQRRSILARLGVSFTVRPHGVQESSRGDAAEVALMNAVRKARGALASHRREAVLGVDTLVTLEGAIFGKPADEAAARAMLGALGGRTHEVLSGVAILIDGEERCAVAGTRVTFRTLEEQTLAWYLARSEWQGRAGGYAIQGAGAALVRAIDGDYENVVGLPVATLLDIYPELLQA